MLPVERLRRGKISIKLGCVDTDVDAYTPVYLCVSWHSLLLAACKTWLQLGKLAIVGPFQLFSLLFSFRNYWVPCIDLAKFDLNKQSPWHSPTAHPQWTPAPVAHSSAHGSPEQILSKMSRRRVYSLLSTYKPSMTAHIRLKREIRALISSSCGKSILFLLKKIVMKQNNDLNNKREKKRLGKKS